MVSGYPPRYYSRSSLLNSSDQTGTFNSIQSLAGGKLRICVVLNVALVLSHSRILVVVAWVFGSLCVLSSRFGWFFRCGWFGLFVLFFVFYVADNFAWFSFHFKRLLSRKDLFFIRIVSFFLTLLYLIKWA